MMQYRSICRQELDRALFAGFVRRQEVTHCWRKVDGAWVIRDVPFVDDWSETDYATLVNCLRRTLAQGRVDKSCIFPPIPLWRVRHFTEKWAAWRQRNMTPPTPPPNPATASWNIF